MKTHNAKNKINRICRTLSSRGVLHKVKFKITKELFIVFIKLLCA